MLMPGGRPPARIIIGTDRKQLCSRSLARLQTLSESCHGAGSHISNCLLSLRAKSGSDSTGSVFLQDGAIIGGGAVVVGVGFEEGGGVCESLFSRHCLWKPA